MPGSPCRVLSAIGFACLVWAWPIAAVPQGRPPRPRLALAAEWPAAKLEAVMTPRDTWRPIPTIGPTGPGGRASRPACARAC